MIFTEYSKLFTTCILVYTWQWRMRCIITTGWAKKKILRRFLFEISLNRMTILFVLDTVYLSCKMLGFKWVEREDK